MKSFAYKVLGISLLFAAIIGIVFSITGIVLTIRIEPRVSQSLSSLLNLLDRTLVTTQAGLTMADSVLEDSVAALGFLETTVDSLDLVVDKTMPTLDSLSDLLGEKLPDTIRSTRQALSSAETAAKNVDNFLSTLSNIPLIGSAIYNPDKPLNQTIGQISTSLQDTPQLLSNSQESVDQMAGSLATIQSDMDSVSGNVHNLTSSAENAREVVQNYQSMISDLQAEVEKLQDNLSTWLRLATWGFILLFVWLAIAQIAIAMQGLEMLSRGKPSASNIESV